MATTPSSTPIDDPHAQEQLHGNPEGVEPTAEVGNRAGNQDVVVRHALETAPNEKARRDRSWSAGLAKSGSVALVTAYAIDQAASSVLLHGHPSPLVWIAGAHIRTTSLDPTNMRENHTPGPPDRARALTDVWEFREVRANIAP